MGRKKVPFNPEPDCETKAREFSEWFAVNSGDLRKFANNYNEDVFSDAFIRAYESIAMACTDVADYVGYFLRTYRTAFIDQIRADRREPDRADERSMFRSEAPSPSYDEEVAFECFRQDLLAALRDRYPAEEVQIFEMYMDGHPHLSYRKLAVMLEISPGRVYAIVSKMKRELRATLSDRAQIVLSMTK